MSVFVLVNDWERYLTDVCVLALKIISIRTPMKIGKYQELENINDQLLKCQYLVMTDFCRKQTLHNDRGPDGEMFIDKIVNSGYQDNLIISGHSTEYDLQRYKQFFTTVTYVPNFMVAEYIANLPR